MRPCSRTDHARAQRRVRELGYPVGKGKWEAFWAGFRAWAAGKRETDCPYPDATPEDIALGRKGTYRRGAWLNGYRAAAKGAHVA